MCVCVYVKSYQPYNQPTNSISPCRNASHWLTIPTLTSPIVANLITFQQEDAKKVCICIWQAIIWLLYNYWSNHIIWLMCWMLCCVIWYDMISNLLTYYYYPFTTTHPSCANNSHTPFPRHVCDNKLTAVLTTLLTLLPYNSFSPCWPSDLLTRYHHYITHPIFSF